MCALLLLGLLLGPFLRLSHTLELGRHSSLVDATKAEFVQNALRYAKEEQKRLEQSIVQSADEIMALRMAQDDS